MFFIGLDLGQAKDYTALAILEQLQALAKPHYHCRYLERVKLGTSYPEVAEYVKDLIARPEIGSGNCRLVVDATGVGRPVVDMLRDKGLHPEAATITGGNTAVQDDLGWRVPKRDLVMGMLVLMQGQRLKFADGLPEVPTLINELMNFEIKITDNAHDTYGAWREGTHDDLVLAVSLAAWFAERSGAGGTMRLAPIKGRGNQSRICSTQSIRK